ncbi:MAG: cysteine desulfurase [Rickettsiales bacterium]|nr:MAG: cysteine desulfurase [Rickettsiales bacterium]
MIYLDHNATTILHPFVKTKMDEIALFPINPSATHSYGRKGKGILENARRSIARLLCFDDCHKDYQVTFTSSGTEANNLILFNFNDAEIFISATEHPSILSHKKFSSNIQTIKVDEDGILDFDDLINKLQNSKSEKKLVSVMLANNETGVIQPIKKIAKIAHEHGAIMHSDCVQAIGKINVNILDLDLDFVSISGHKFGGPIGVGALIGKASILLKPMILGGGQEKNLRAGTENVHGIAGLGEAALLAKKELTSRNTHMRKLQKQLESALLESFPEIKIAGMKSERLPNTSLILNSRKKAEIQLIAFDLKNIAISSGSACSSGKIGLSYVLEEMGCSEREARSAIRVSVGAGSTEEDIDNFIKIYKEINKESYA